VNVTIDYAYDPLYRLTAADYSTGEFFHYTYDAVGNRLTQQTHEGSNVYVYDIANRLIEVDGVSFVWDDNGNLIQDDRAIYAYDYANRLKVVLMGGDQYLFDYNGLGDRLRQTVNGAPAEYTLDINTTLTQVLWDGANDYLYGVRRIGEQQPEGWQYHLIDALGSVRQLSDAAAAVTLAQAYEPFGGVLNSAGGGATPYGFTGERTDPAGLVYLRARYYAPGLGRFISRDVWEGDPRQPLSYNPWIYVLSNPATMRDPTGRQPISDLARISGYAEGRIVAASTGTFWLIQGREVVYDFHTMERAQFTFTNLYAPTGVCLGLDIAESDYFTIVYGFDVEGLLGDWEGKVIAGQVGFDFPIPIAEVVSVGAGVSPFFSVAENVPLPDLDIVGLDVYISASLGVSSPIYIASFMINTTYAGGFEEYGDDIAKMKRDILAGDGSPAILLARLIRNYAAGWAEEYYGIHHP